MYNCGCLKHMIFAINRASVETEKETPPLKIKKLDPVDVPVTNDWIPSFPSVYLTIPIVPSGAEVCFRGRTVQFERLATWRPGQKLQGRRHRPAGDPGERVDTPGY